MSELILLTALILFVGLPSLAVLSACIMASRIDQKEEAARVQAKSTTFAPRPVSRLPRGLAWRVEKPEA